MTLTADSEILAHFLMEGSDRPERRSIAFAPPFPGARRPSHRLPVNSQSAGVQLVDRLDGIVTAEEKDMREGSAPQVGCLG